MTDLEGNVAGVKILKSESSVLNEPAINAVKEWKYEPLVLNGNPTPVIFTITVSFRLK
jgi:TonB family protein